MWTTYSMTLFHFSIVSLRIDLDFPWPMFLEKHLLLLCDKLSLKKLIAHCIYIHTYICVCIILCMYFVDFCSVS
jgi:hypothetical protein